MRTLYTIMRICVEKGFDTQGYLERGKVHDETTKCYVSGNLKRGFSLKKEDVDYFIRPFTQGARW